jgi:DNA gyrase subunit A
VGEISVLSRNTQGVTVIRLNAGEKVVGMDRIASLPDGEGEEPDNGSEHPAESE